MKKIAINRKYGGFSLSNEAMLMYLEKTYPSEKIEVLKDDSGEVEDAIYFVSHPKRHYEIIKSAILCFLFSFVDKLTDKSDGLNKA